MSVRIVDCLATTGAMADVFSDDSIVGGMLRFEVALAAAEAKCGVIPADAAPAIARAAGLARDYDMGAIARAARDSATPAVPFVEQLVARVTATAPAHARFVHFGATSQDVVDTALVLALGRARAILAADHAKVLNALRALSDAHASTAMLGRTLLQPGPPVTFGLTAAQWHHAAATSGRRLLAAFDAAACVQLGGAVGTRAAFGARGDQVADALARQLQLTSPIASWHTTRDRLGALVAACGLHVATLGKMARDVSLLMQHEVGEVAERGGGSSTMPHKRNPASCVIVLAAATRVPPQVAGFLTGMVQEHERAAGGLQAELPAIAAIVEATGSAVDAAAHLLAHLEVFPARMLANIEATGGVIFAERVSLALVGVVGREASRRLVASALERCRAEGGTFASAVRATPEIAQSLPADVIATIDDPRAYLGDADVMRRRLLADSGTDTDALRRD